MRMSLYTGIDAKQNFLLDPPLFRLPINLIQLAERISNNTADSRVQRLSDFAIQLIIAVHIDLLSGETSFKRRVELPA